LILIQNHNNNYDFQFSDITTFRQHRNWPGCL